MDQKDSFYEGPGLWNSLLRRELNGSDHMVESMKRSRDVLKKDRKQLIELEAQIDQLSHDSAVYLDSLQEMIVSIGRVMTPEQLAKFITWVQSSEWCMQMLDIVWCEEPRDS
jgi:hypothetical protein